MPSSLKRSQARANSDKSGITFSKNIFVICLSKSITNTFKPRLAKYQASCAVTVVLPTPPLSLELPKMGRAVRIASTIFLCNKLADERLFLLLTD
uniref:Uncharacterized protein n=1 Tax=Yersinia enterocolitica TaxID=630 RepID=B0RL01_YEREN|nr:hypothetical protein [Yersinia enterocolitica]